MPDAPQITREQALAGLAELINTPLARGVIRYWWASVPLAALTWHYWNQRKKKGEATVGNIIQDIAPAVSIVAAGLTINVVLGQLEKPRKAASLPPGPVQDAQFTAIPTGQPDDQSSPPMASLVN
jgi:hypothetical protein